MAWRRLLALAVLGMLSSCRGADGAMGPAGADGPAGPIGLPGPAGPAGPSGATLTFQQSVVAMDVVFPLPAAAGDATHPPLASGYVSGDPVGGSWVQVSDAFSVDSPFLAFRFTGGAWTITMKNAPIGFSAILVVKY
jgi:hypothetical protein